MAGPRIAPSLAGYIPPGPGSGPQVVPRRGILDELENLSYGIGQGQVAQLEGLKALFTQPAQTITGLYRAATNPRATIAAMAADTMQKARGGPIGVGQLVGEMLSPRSLLGVNAATQALRKPGLLEIDVYHGSPNEFDAFDSSKIGTGEGQQAYGHGIYVSETPTIAKSYQASVSAMQNAGDVTVNGKKIDWDDPAQVAAFELARHSGDRAAAADFHAQTFVGGENNPAVKLLRSNQKLPEAKLPGFLYTADLPDEMVDRMLDWDKPLSEQPAAVQAAAKARLAEIRALGGSPPDNPSGEWLHRAFQPQAGEQGFGQSLAADRLRQAGIPGIRYLDAGSRGQGGSGTRNFVVFPGEEKRVRILKRE